MSDTVREYRYVVDRDGRVFHDGTEIVDPLTLRFFLRAMKRTEDGRWLVVCQGEHNWFDADTPFVVQRLRLSAGADGLTGVELLFAGDVKAPLDPATLESDRADLYSRIGREGLRARFGRIAIQQLAPYLGDDRGDPVLVMNGVRHPIRDPLASDALSPARAPRNASTSARAIR